METGFLYILFWNSLWRPDWHWTQRSVRPWIQGAGKRILKIIIKKKTLKFHSQVFDQSLITPFHIRHPCCPDSRNSRLAETANCLLSLYECKHSGVVGWQRSLHHHLMPGMSKQKRGYHQRAFLPGIVWDRRGKENILCPVLKSLFQSNEVTVKFFQFHSFANKTHSSLTYTPQSLMLVCILFYTAISDLFVEAHEWCSIRMYYCWN